MTSQYLRDSTGALTGPTLQQAVFAGTVDPGNIVAVREVLLDDVVGTDIALFSGARANFTMAANADGSITVTDTTGTEGVDTLRNIETLRFCTANDPVTGACTAFTDVAAPVIPRVTSTSPANGAVGVNVGANVTATFSTSLNPTFVTNTSVRLRNTATLVNVGSAVSYDDATRTVTLNPNANLAPGTSYTLTLLGGTGVNAIRDTAGNRLPTNVTMSFTTAGDTTAPVVTTSTPVDGATGVARGCQPGGELQRTSRRTLDDERGAAHRHHPGACGADRERGRDPADGEPQRRPGAEHALHPHPHRWSERDP